MGRKWKQPKPPEIMRKGGAHTGRSKPILDFDFEGEWDEYVDEIDMPDECVEELYEYRHGEEEN